MNGVTQYLEDEKAFFTTLCTGGSNEVSHSQSRLINSFATDGVYWTSGGKIYQNCKSVSTKLRPSNIRKHSKACIGLPWDNFDINLDTLFKTESIHYTFGICHQNISIDEEEGVAVYNSNDANKEYTEQFVSVTVNNRKWKITEDSPNNI